MSAISRWLCKQMMSHNLHKVQLKLGGVAETIITRRLVRGSPNGILIPGNSMNPGHIKPGTQIRWKIDTFAWNHRKVTLGACSKFSYIISKVHQITKETNNISV